MSRPWFLICLVVPGFLSVAWWLSSSMSSCSFWGQFEDLGPLRKYIFEFIGNLRFLLSYLFLSCGLPIQLACIVLHPSTFLFLDTMIWFLLALCSSLLFPQGFHPCHGILDILDLLSRVIRVQLRIWLVHLHYWLLVLPRPAYLLCLGGMSTVSNAPVPAHGPRDGPLPQHLGATLGFFLICWMLSSVDYHHCCSLLRQWSDAASLVWALCHSCDIAWCFLLNFPASKQVAIEFPPLLARALGSVSSSS